VAKSQADALLK
jgi:hypothetical protein